MEMHKITALVRHAYSLPEGKSRTALLQEAVRGADVLNDLDVQFDVRVEFIHSAARSDDMPKMMAAVAWCQGVYDAEPERFDVEQMLGALATAVNCSASIYQLTREQCEAMHADYKRRLQAAGCDLQTYHQKRSYNALWMGDLAVAKEHFHRMLKLTTYENPWDRLFRSDYYLQMGDVDLAWEEAKPLVLASDDADGTFHWAASFLLSEMVQRRQRWLAARCQKRAYAMLKGNPDHIELIGHHLMYFAVARKWSAGAAMLERHLNWALEAFPHRELFEFHVGAWRFCRDASINKPRLTVQLPAALPGSTMEGAGSMGELVPWFQQQSETLAEKFDQRNGNKHFASIIEKRVLDVGP